MSAGTVVIAACAAAAVAQPNRLSPHEQTSAVVAGARIAITYGRPSMHGRVIFGALVPFNRVWCPGADEATVLDSDRPLRFGGVEVPPGPHTIWMLPTKERWTFIVSREPSGFHTRYHADADLGRVAMTLRRLDRPVEQLTLAVVGGAAARSGSITMTWEQTTVSAGFMVGQ